MAVTCVNSESPSAKWVVIIVGSVHSAAGRIDQRHYMPLLQLPLTSGCRTIGIRLNWPFAPEFCATMAVIADAL